MPELKRGFTGGKMEKDLDERIIPQGLYREALNVEISTSEDSDVGSVQNILNNVKVTETLRGPAGKYQNKNKHIAHTFDPETSKLYRFTSTEAANSQVWMDRITEYDTTKSYTNRAKSTKDGWSKKEKPVFIDVYKVGSEVIEAATFETVTINSIDYNCNRTVITVTQNAFQLRWNMRVTTSDPLVSVSGPAIRQFEGIAEDIYIEDITWHNVAGEIQARIRLNGDFSKDDNGNTINWLEKKLFFHADRVLNFHPDRKITGINVIDGMIFWTDNYSEPKKIDIERCKLGSQYYVGQSEHSSWQYRYFHFDQHTRLITNVNPLTKEGVEAEECSKDDIICPTEGCMDPLAFNYDPNADIPCTGILPSGGNTTGPTCCCFVAGCMDPNAFNYDPLACHDDGSCIPIVAGCMDSTACNYNSNANVACGDPNYPVSAAIPCVGGQTWSAAMAGVSGCCCEILDCCTDPNALNYDPNANCDDGSCIMCTPHCTPLSVTVTTVDDTAFCGQPMNGDGAANIAITLPTPFPPLQTGSSGTYTIVVEDAGGGFVYVDNAVSGVGNINIPVSNLIGNQQFRIHMYLTDGNLVSVNCNPTGPSPPPITSVNNPPQNPWCTWMDIASFLIHCTPPTITCGDPQACNYDPNAVVMNPTWCWYDCETPCASSGSITQNLTYDPHFWFVWDRSGRLSGDFTTYPPYQLGPNQKFFNYSSGWDGQVGIGNSCPNITGDPSVTQPNNPDWIPGCVQNTAYAAATGGDKGRVWRAIECAIQKNPNPLETGKWYGWTEARRSGEGMAVEVDPFPTSDTTTYPQFIQGETMLRIGFAGSDPDGVTGGGSGYNHCSQTTSSNFVENNPSGIFQLINPSGLGYQGGERYQLRMYVTTGFVAHNSYPTKHAFQNGQVITSIGGQDPKIKCHVGMGRIGMSGATGTQHPWAALGIPHFHPTKYSAQAWHNKIPVTSQPEILNPYATGTPPITWHGSLIAAPLDKGPTASGTYNAEYDNNTSVAGFGSSYPTASLNTTVATTMSLASGEENQVLWVDPHLGGSVPYEIDLPNPLDGSAQWDASIPNTAIATGGFPVPQMGSPEQHWFTNSEHVSLEFVWPDIQRYKFTDATNTSNVEQETDFNYDILALSFYQDMTPCGIRVPYDVIFTPPPQPTTTYLTAHEKFSVWVREICIQKCPSGICPPINSSI